MSEQCYEPGGASLDGAAGLSAGVAGLSVGVADGVPGAAAGGSDVGVADATGGSDAAGVALADGSVVGVSEGVGVAEGVGVSEASGPDVGSGACAPPPPPPPVVTGPPLAGAGLDVGGAVVEGAVDGGAVVAGGVATGVVVTAAGAAAAVRWRRGPRRMSSCPRGRRHAGVRSCSGQWRRLCRDARQHDDRGSGRRRPSVDDVAHGDDPYGQVVPPVPKSHLGQALGSVVDVTPRRCQPAGREGVLGRAQPVLDLERLPLRTVELGVSRERPSAAGTAGWSGRP